MATLEASPNHHQPLEAEGAVGVVDFDENELQQGRDVTVQVKRSSIDNVSALTNSGVESSLPVVSEDEAEITTKPSTSMETEALWEQTNRLIERTKNMQTTMSSFKFGVGLDPDADIATGGSTDPEGDNGNAEYEHGLDESDLDLMMRLEQAGQLASNLMMGSISENISHPSGGGETSSAILRKEKAGYSVTTNEHSYSHQQHQQQQMSMSSVRSSSSKSKRDPNGSSPQKHEAVIQSTPDTAHLTPSSTDDASSQGGKKSLRQDPPGSTTAGAPGNQNEAWDNFKMELMSPTPTAGIGHQRPTSAVHLTGMMDDDVSSVGSQSFRPYNYSQRGDTPRQFQHQLSYDSQSPPQQKDDLLGVLPSSRKKKANMDNTNNKVAGSQVDSSIPEAYDQEPVCTKIPPTDLRFDYDVVDSSSPRNASVEGAVQWEKVETAAPGEEDYVPLVDYSHIRPSSSGGSPGGGISQGSRLERHRKRVEARNRRRKKILSVALPVVLAMLAGVYYQYFHRGVEEVVIVEEEQEEMVPLWKTYDTTLLQDPSADGFCFEDDNHSMLVTFPKFIPPPEEPEKPRRGLFGRRRQIK